MKDSAIFLGVITPVGRSSCIFAVGIVTQLSPFLFHINITMNSLLVDIGTNRMTPLSRVAWMM